MIVSIISDKYQEIESVCKTIGTAFCRRLNYKEEVGNLKQYFSQNKNIINFDVFVIDLDCIDENAAEILEALNLYKNLFFGKLVLIAKNTPTATAFFARLINLHFYNNIIVKDDTDIKKELLSCIMDGKTYRDNITHKNEGIKAFVKELISTGSEIPKGVKLNINVACFERRSGVTTQALKICRYLQSFGFKSCYVDPNGSHLQNFIDVFDLADSETATDIACVDGLSICNYKPLEYSEYNAFVTDMAVIGSPDDVIRWGQADIKILCSGAKPWELSQTISAIQSVDITPDVVIYMSASDGEQNTIQSIDTQLHLNSVFAPYTPDFWTSDGKNFYDSFLKAKIKDVIASADTSNH